MKPTIYIDQNILSYLEDKTITFPQDEFQCVYSETHFKEIPTVHKKSYFGVLDELNAVLVKIQLNEKFEIIDEVRFIDHHPVSDLFESFQETVEQSNYESIFDPFLAQLAGGKIQETSNSPLSQMLENLHRSGSLNEESAKLSNSVNLLIQSLFSTLAESLQNIESIEKQRSQIGTDKGKLLELNDENSIENIGEIIKNKMGYDILAKVSENISEKPYYAKVVMLNSFLNHIGYNADTKLSSIRKIPNIRHDAEHMANGIFCNNVISEDRRFVMKAKAIYNYLKIKTRVIQLKIEK
jgi:hypothetical protein